MRTQRDRPVPARIKAENIAAVVTKIASVPALVSLGYGSPSAASDLESVAGIGADRPRARPGHRRAAGAVGWNGVKVVQMTQERSGEEVQDASRVRVAVIEDHPLYRVSVERVLAEAEFVELGAVVDSVARFHVHRQPPGSVVLLDLGLPGVAGVAAVLEICELGHHVLVVSAQAEPDVVLGAIAAGARGFLSKDVDADELLLAIRTVASGGAYVSAVVAGMIIKDNADHPATSPEVQLSPREEQVLRLVARGERDTDIAEALTIGVRTVRGYLDRIRDKLGLRRRPELVRWAIQHGYLRAPGLPPTGGRR